jgi:two-component system NarL family sensor kinase
VETTQLTTGAPEPSSLSAAGFEERSNARRVERRRRWLRALTSPVALFAITGLVAATVLAVGEVLVTRHQAADESLRNARDVTRVLAATLATKLDDKLVRGEPAAIARLDNAVRAGVLVRPVVRLKIWAPNGRILYSDEHRLIGSTYPLGKDDVAALRSGGLASDVSDLSRPENRFERNYGRLLQVYMGVTTRSHHRLLLETYNEYAALARERRQLLSSFAPVTLGGLALLWLVQLPLAASLARRLRRRREENELLLLRALDATESERRRIAADLHDSVVQDLLGISYGLHAAAERSDSATPNENRQAFRTSAGQVRENLRQLRTLLVKVYPASLAATGLAPAIEQIAMAPLSETGVRARLDIDPQLELHIDAEELIFRTAQEAIRNVSAHAQATEVEVILRRAGRNAELTISDNGVGFDAHTIVRRRHEHHFGLEMLADRAGRLGGTLSMQGSPGGGTTLILVVPAS